MTFRYFAFSLDFLETVKLYVYCICVYFVITEMHSLQFVKAVAM